MKKGFRLLIFPVLLSFMFCATGMSDSPGPIDSGGASPQPPTTFIPTPTGSPTAIASGSPAPIYSPTSPYAPAQRSGGSYSAGLTNIERYVVSNLGDDTVHFLTVGGGGTAISQQALLSSSLRRSLSEGIELETLPQNTFEGFLNRLDGLYEKLASDAEGFLAIKVQIDIELKNLMNAALYDSSIYESPRDVVVVDAVDFTREIRDIHRLMNPPRRLHPWLKWLLYLNRVTPKMLEFYQAAIERRDRIYTLATKSDGKLKIRYQGRVMDVPIFVWPDEAEGLYELVMVHDESIRLTRDASAAASTVGQTPTP